MRKIKIFKKGDEIEVIGKNKENGTVYGSYTAGTRGIVEKTWIDKNGYQWLKVFWGKNLSGQKLVGSILSEYVMDAVSIDILARTVDRWKFHFLQTINVSASASIGTMYKYFYLEDFSKLEERDFINTWAYANLARNMLLKSLSRKAIDYSKNYYLLPQIGGKEYVERVNKEFMKRGYDFKYCLFINGQ